MDWARVKTILIFVLLLVNAVLAVILVSRYREAGGAKSRELAEALAVLELAGYELTQEQLPDAYAPVLDLLRDTDAEQAAAVSLFGGPATVIPLSEGGASVRYVCPLGEAVFRTGGSFELEPYQPIETDDIQAALSGWLRGTGFLSGDGSPDIAVTENAAYVRAMRGGLKSWDEEAAADMEDGKVVLISGRWQLGEAGRSASGDVSGSATSALLSLAEYLGTSGASPGKLLDMELGYSLEVLSSEITRFTPCWRVTLESGTYSVNALTGGAEPIRYRGEN